MHTKLFTVAAIALFTGNVFAADLSYTFLEVQYAEADLDGIDASGVGAVGSFAITDNFFLGLGFASLETDDKFTHPTLGFTDEIEAEGKTIAIGFNTPMGKKTDFVGSFSYTDAEAKFGFLKEDSSSRSLDFGFRSMLSNWFELNGGVSFVDSEDDSDAGIGIGIRAYLTDNFSIGLSYSKLDDIDGTTGSLRLSF